MKSWHANAERPPGDAEDTLFPTEEAALDAAFEAVEDEEHPHAASVTVLETSLDAEQQKTLDAIRAAIAPKPQPATGVGVNAVDPAALNQATRAFDRRLRLISRTLPFSRVRRLARIVGLTALAVLVGGGVAFRTQIVTVAPSLAGIYSAIGLPVNVVGLEFEDAKTLTSLRNAVTVMQVRAKIRSVASTRVPVPPVLVSLLDANRTSVYEWTVVPKAADLEPGEVLDFSAEVNAPPANVTGVRLSFTNARDPASNGKSQ
jgi:hypothetical protein